jgi:hypothetical protein
VFAAGRVPLFNGVICLLGPETMHVAAELSNFPGMYLQREYLLSSQITSMTRRLEQRNRRTVTIINTDGVNGSEKSRLKFQEVVLLFVAVS